MFSSGLGAHFSHTQAKKARQFTREVMNNRYQWMMQDMRQAGLNPILAYQQGPGGGSGAPQGQQPGIPRTNYAITAKQVQMMDAELKKLKADTRKSLDEADAAVTRSVLDGAKAITETEIRPYLVGGANSAEALKRAQAIATQLENRLRKVDADYIETPTGEKLRELERAHKALPWLGPVIDQGNKYKRKLLEGIKHNAR